MNNRFKFRVWDKVSKRYFYLELKFGDNGYHPDFIIDPVFEQCTGLKDKNGYRIYEGDTVQYWWNQKTNTGTICWNNEFARFCIANNEIHCPEDSNCLMFVSDKKIIEIIGNIHEQAEQKD